MSTNDITDRVIYKYIINELSRNRMLEIESQIKVDANLRNRVKNIKIKMEKENSMFLKKHPAKKQVPAIIEKAKQKDKQMEKQSRKEAKPNAKPKRTRLFGRSFSRPVLVASLGSLVLIVGILSVQYLQLNGGSFDIAQGKISSGPAKEKTGEESSELAFLDERDTDEVESPAVEEVSDSFAGDDRNISTKSELSVVSGNDMKNKKSLEREKTKLGQIYFDGKRVPFGKLLEFQVQLNFEVINFVDARKKLFKMIDKYGYIDHSAASANNDTHMNTSFYVRSSQLNKFLIEVEKVGKLVFEEIHAIDHTANHAWQKTLIRREGIRGKRKQNALKGSPSRKNWQDREDSLSGSEDNLDKAQHEKWKIMQRIEWARVEVSMLAPPKVKSIDTPAFRDTFVNLVSILLSILNALIYILPVTLVGWLIYRSWKKYLNKKSG